MRKPRAIALATLILTAGMLLASTPSRATIDGFKEGNPEIKSISTIAFGADGVLFVGDSKSGAVFAIDTGDITAAASEEPLSIPDLEAKIAPLLGADAAAVMIHDMAVNPVSQSVYVAASRGRSRWESRWTLPNDLEDAKVILRINAAGDIDEFDLGNVSYMRADLPNPVDMNQEHSWKKGTELRVDAITDIAYHDGRLFVAGLSNEEFASTMWYMPFPFDGSHTYSTLEIYHGAHGEYETHAPIRTFLPYTVDNQAQLLAAYLCTPLVTFTIEDLGDGEHVKGKTVAEFGSGNYPLDMVLYQKDGKDFVVMSNSQLPLLIFDPADVIGQESITSEVEGYTAGVPYEVRSGSGIQHIDRYNEQYILAIQRTPNGKLAMGLLDIRRL